MLMKHSSIWLKLSTNGEKHTQAKGSQREPEKENVTLFKYNNKKRFSLSCCKYLNEIIGVYLYNIIFYTINY